MVRGSDAALAAGDLDLGGEFSVQLPIDAGLPQRQVDLDGHREQFRQVEHILAFSMQRRLFELLGDLGFIPP